MGVVLVTALVLAGACVFIELKLVYTTPIKHIIQKGAAFGIIFSLTLSMIIGTLFGAAGLTIMLAGVIAVTVTEPIHGLIRRYKKSSLDSRDKIKEGVDDFIATWKPAFNFVVLCLKILTAPVWVPMKIRRWWLDQKTPKTTYTKVAV